MTKVIGLDTSSTCSGWSIFVDGEYKESGCFNLKNVKDSTERLEQMCKSIMNLLSYHKPDIVVIETPVVTRNPQVQRLLTTIYGVVYGECLKDDIEFVSLRPTEWRKYARDKDEKLPRKRDELKLWSICKIRKLLDIEVGDDEADAVLIPYGYIKQYR